jgi:hypothetical protein
MHTDDCLPDKSNQCRSQRALIYPIHLWVARVGVVTLRVAWVAMLNLTPTQHTASVSASVKHKEHACAKQRGAAVRVLWVFPVWKTGGHAE